MAHFLLLVISAIAVLLVLVLVRIIVRITIFDIIFRGILPFAIVRFLTWTVEHWMGSTIAWALSIIAGIAWGVYPRLKQWFTDPHGTLRDVRETDARIAREWAEFNREYNQHKTNANDDGDQKEVERCMDDEID